MANEVLVAILLTLAAAGLATMYAQQAWHITTTVQQQVSGELKEPMEKYISIFRASITRVEGNTYRIQASVYNGGEWDYNYALASFVISDGNGFVRVITSPKTTCPDVLPAGKICTFSADVNYPGDPHNLSLVVRIDRVELYVRPTVIPPAEVPATYFICHSCAECNAVINEGNYGQVIIDISTPVSGDCITVKRSNIVISCQTPLVGDGTGTAIHFDNVSGVTLKNCRIENFHTALYFDRSYALSLVNIDLVNHTIYAKWSVKPGACALGDLNVITDKGPLPYYYGVSGSTILHTPGVWLAKSTGVTISDLNTPIVSPAIVLCGDAATSVVDVNIPTGPADIGLASFGSTGFTITGFYSLATNGMLFEDPEGGEVEGNVEVR